MKKVLLFVLAALFAYTMNAQTIFSESFENGLDAWTTTDSDGDGNDWLTTSDYANAGAVAPHSGTYYAISQSWNSSDGALTPNNWMVTNQAITIPEAGYSLIWYESGTTYSSNVERCAVYVSTSNNISNMTSAVQDAVITVSANGVWTRKSVELDAYAGQTVYIAFRHYNCTDGEILAIDDIEVSKPTTTPEIELTSIDLGGSYGYLGDEFSVKGTVTNLSANALTSFTVNYSVDGANSTPFNVTGINVANGETYEFTHNVAPTYVVGYNHVTVTVSNPNGTADNTANNTKTDSIYIVECNANTLPYSMGFETGIVDDCWHIVDTSAWMNAYSYIQQYAQYGYPFAANNGINAILSAEAGSIIYTQVQLPTGADMINMKFYAMLSYDGADYYSAIVSPVISTTGTERANFQVINNSYIDLEENSYNEFNVDLTAYAGQTVYVGFKHQQGAWILIDDVTIETVSSTPEIELTQITTPAAVDENATVNVTGIVKNHSSAPLTTFDVVYTFDGTASAVYSVTGINVAYEATYEFTHNVPIANIAGGDHTLVVTVSNPNGETDNTEDNSLTKNVYACSSVTAPFTETFDNGQGCWKAVDANNDGYNWMTLSEYFPLIGYDNPQYVANYSYGGSGDAMVSESYRDDAITADNWLISPAIVIPNDGNTYVATWYARSVSSGYLDSYSVHIGTSGNATALSGSTQVYSGDAEAEYTQHAAVLDAYAGQTIYIGFHHTSTDMFALIIDQFEIAAVSTTPEIALTEISAPIQVGSNTAYVVNGTVVNNSATALTSFDVACTADGQTTNQQITGINVPYLGSYSFAIDMPGIASLGDKTVTMTVSNPNGTADNTNDNTQTTSVNIYDASNSVPRTVLLENFTTASCGNCPGAHTRVQNAIGTTYTNNVIWVAHHSGYGTDALTMDLDETMEVFFNEGGSTYAPAIMLDRTYWGNEAFTLYSGEYSPGPAFLPQNDVADALALATSQPAFVTVNLSGLNYNSSTRALSVTVSGNVTDNLGTSDARLNVWLIEDGLLADDGTGVGHGPSQSGASGTFYHNHVIRENLSGDDWGEANVVTATSGSNYTKTYTTTVSNNYDASKCYIVAFVSNGNHSNVNDCRVYNAGKSAYITNEQPGPGPQPQGIDDVNAMNVKLYPNPTTGNLYIEVEGLQKVEVIDAVGRIVMTQTTGNSINMSNLANGVYTVRVMANGTTAVKKVVKK